MPSNIPRITGRTRLAGVIGNPIGHTLSPAMQNAALAAAKIDAVYVPFGVRPEGLRPLLTALHDIGALGVNVTIPYKVAAFKIVHELSPAAQRIGAINTIVFTHNKMIGHNTDGLGCLATLQGHVTLKGQNAVLLGAGGAGRAVAVSLCDAGLKRLTISELRQRPLTKLLYHLKRLGCMNVFGVQPDSAKLRAALGEAKVVINATPLGMHHKDHMPVDPAWLRHGCAVLDLVYGNGVTRFLRAAKRRGCRVFPGWHMLLHQGAAAFELWTARKAPIAIMRKALIEAGMVEVG